MSQSISGTNHYVGSAPFTTNPWTIHVGLTTAGGQARKFVSVGKTTDLTQGWICGSDITSATNKASIYDSSSSGTGQAITTAAMDVAGNWNWLTYSVGSTSRRSTYLNGANKGSQTTTLADPTGINGFIVSGRITDFTSGIGGQVAHLALWLRELSDAEASYVGGGGNPRAIKGLTGYWKFNPADLTTVPDEIATNDLTVSGTATAGTTNPNTESFCTSATITSQSATQGTAYGGVTVAFDGVNSAFTVSSQQLTSLTSLAGVTSSALTNVREIPVSSVTGVVANNYLKVGANAPTRILAVNVTASTIVVAADQTYASGATLQQYSVSPLTISGLNTTALAGTPSTSGTFALCLMRATCNGNSALVADSNPFTLTIASSGGGGGGVKLVAGQYAGGFSGG